MPYRPTTEDISGQILGKGIASAGDMFATAFQEAQKMKEEESMLGGHVAAAVKSGVLEPEVLSEFVGGNRNKKMQLGTEAQLLLKQYEQTLQPPAIQLTPAEQQDYARAGMIPVRTSRGGFQAVEIPRPTPVFDPKNAPIVDMGPDGKVIVLPKGYSGVTVKPGGGAKAPFTPSPEDIAWAQQNGYKFMPQSASGSGSWVRSPNARPPEMEIELPDGRIVKGTVQNGGFKALPGQTPPRKGTGTGTKDPDAAAADKAAALFYQVNGAPTLQQLTVRRDAIIKGLQAKADPKGPGDLPEDRSVEGTLNRLNREIAARQSAPARTAAPKASTPTRPAPTSSANAGALNEPPLPTSDPLAEENLPPEGTLGLDEVPTLTPEQAAKAPSGTRFKGTDGQIRTKR